MECRLILSCNKLGEKKAAVYTVIMSKAKEEALNLTEAIQTWTKNIQTDERTTIVKNVDCKVDGGNTPVEKRNPFLNNTVLTCLFEFLSLDEIKGSRFVCRQWNSTAEVYLRRRSAICLRRNGLQLGTFIEFCKYSLPNLPFSAYRFSDDGVNNTMSVPALENFFDTLGKSVKEITFENIRLITAEGSELLYYDITPRIFQMSNLSISKLKCQKYAAFEISIESLLSLKTVFLENCKILVINEIYTRPTPSNISLTNTRFKRLGNNTKEFGCNDFFDFSLARNISIKDDYESGWLATLDMEGIQFNANQLRMHFINLENWEKSRGDVDFVRLRGCVFSKTKNQLKIKRFDIGHGFFDFSILPKTIEKISLGRNLYAVGRESLHLINLKHITLDLELNNSEILKQFENCPNFMELDIIIGETVKLPPTLHLDCIPKSVQKMRLKANSDFNFVKSNCKLELDTLILKDSLVYSDFTFSKTALENIKPKLLVTCYSKRRFIHAVHITKNILANNTHIGKIAVGALDDDVKKISFEEILFSECVDNNSGCYVFENQIGRVITSSICIKWII